MNFIKSNRGSFIGSQAGYAATKITALFVIAVLLITLLVPVTTFGTDEEAGPTMSSVSYVWDWGAEGAPSDAPGTPGPFYVDIGGSHVVSTEGYSDILVTEGAPGVWSFNGWSSSGTIEGITENITITGTWTWTPATDTTSGAAVSTQSTEPPVEDGGEEGEGSDPEEKTVTITYVFPEGTEDETFTGTIGQPVASAGVPQSSTFPNDYGFVNFRGWFTDADPAPGASAFDLNSEIEGDLTLYAIFSDKYLMTYLDQDGTVIQTSELSQGDSIQEPTTDTINKVVVPEGERLTHWYVKGDDSANAFIFGAKAQSDMIFVPYFSNSFVVTFYSGGSYVEPQAVKGGSYAVEPVFPPPTRAGYTLDYWYDKSIEDEEGEVPSPFDFNTPITKDTLLAAKWSPKVVEYTVAIWLEKPGYNAAFTPTAGNQAQYNYVTSVTLSGTAGAKTALDVNNLPSSIAFLFTGGHDLLKYGTPQSVENRDIQGNGLTVINLYAARKVYTYEFNLGTTSSNTMTIGDTTYRGGNNSVARYSIPVKYEMDISGIFPVQGVSFATFSSGLASWSRDTGMTWQDSAGIASIRKIVDAGMLSKNGQQSSYTLTASWTAGNTSYQYRYWAEQLPEQAGDTSLTRNGITYVLMEEYNQSFSANLNQKNISGLNNVSASWTKGITTYEWTAYTYNNGDGTYTFDASNPLGTNRYRCFFYTRTEHPLTFNMMLPGGETVQNTPGNAKLMFEESLAAYEPSATPSVASGDYIFAGWYRDSGYKEELDFESLKMPIGGMIVYAKWESTDNTVTFLDGRGSATVVDTQGIADGGNATDRYWATGAFVAGKGDFAGWAYDISGIPVPWTWETQVNTDYTVYAMWRTYGFTVTYNVGAGSGEAPKDNLTYSIGTSARVLDAGSEMTPPEGQVFYAWKDEAANRIYYAGDLINIGENGNVTLVAQYAALTDLVTITYHSNNDANQNKSYHVPRGTDAYSVAGELFTSPNRTLIGWTMTKDAETADYALGAAYVDQNNASITIDSDLDFYGVWGKASITITFGDDTKVYGDTATGSASITAGSLLSGHALSYANPKSITTVAESGAYGNGETWIIVDGEGKDVTGLYDATVEEGTLEITKRTLVFRAMNQTMVAGGTVPTLTYYMDTAYDALVQGDVLNVYAYLTGSYDTNAAGVYADVIAIGFNAAELKALEGNYNIYTTPGTLTVTEAGGGTTGGGGGGETTGGGGGGVVVAQPVEITLDAVPAISATPVSAPADAPTVVLPGEQTPQAAFASWALLNLILTIVTGLIMLALLVTYFAKRKEDEEAEEDPDRDQNIKKRLGVRILSIVATIVALVLFILTQDMSLPMTWTDSWTIWHIVITAATVLIAFFSRKKYEEEELGDVRA